MGSLLAARKSVLVAFLSSLLFVFGYTSAMPAAADCDANYIIHCGVNSAGDVSNHYGDTGVAAVYSYFGISSADVNNMGSQAVLGDVYSNGDVKIQKTVNGETKYPLVATDAVTAGWQNISGSTTVTSGGHTFYVRPTSVSFQSSPLTAYVMMKNGKFDFAVLKDCGNPVKGTPVTMPTPPPAPTPPPPAPTPPPPAPQPKPMPPPQPAPTPLPAPSQSQTQTQSQSQNQSQTVYVTQPQQQTQTTTAAYTAPPPAPPPATTSPQPAPTTYKLPNTGPGDVIGLASAFGLCVGLAHYTIFGRRSTRLISGVKYF